MSISVLVIDDDDAFRGLAVQVLEGMGFDVVGEADTLKAGAAAAKTLRPDAMLIDVALPDGSGVGLAGDLAALPWRPRIVLTSSDPSVVSQSVARAAGAAAFIPKQDLPGGRLRDLLAGQAREE